MVIKSTTDDAYGQMLLVQHERGEELSEIIERDDNYIDYGSRPGYYISEYKHWSRAEKQALKLAKGHVLDIGCGAGRHSLYLQERGFDVTGIDNSPGAIKVCKKRGLKKALVRPIEELAKFKTGSFDTVLMLGNNFGLVGSPQKGPSVLSELDRITTEDALIIAGTLNPYGTKNPVHLQYHRFNKKRGRLPGQLTIRARFANLIGPWFDYLLVSPDEMDQILEDSNWRVKKILGDREANYLAVLAKRR